MDGIYNPNGSIAAIEGITSPDGRILGKWGTQSASEVKFSKMSQVITINYCSKAE